MTGMRFEQAQRFILAKKYFGVRVTLRLVTRFARLSSNLADSYVAPFRVDIAVSVGQ